MPVLSYLIKLALRPWRLAPMSQALCTGAVALLLFLAGFLVWMQSGLQGVLTSLQGEQIVTAYIDPELDGAKAAQIRDTIGDTIRLTLGAHPLRELRYVDAQKFVEELKPAYPDLSRELSELGNEMDSVVPRYVQAAGLLPDETLEKVRAIPGVASAESSRDRYRAAIGAFHALRWVARVLILGLGLAMLAGLVLLTRANASVHAEAMALLRVWGASSFRIGAPAAISGMMIGIAGGALAAVTWVSAGAWVARQVRALSPMLRDLPPASPAMAACLLAAGAMLGVIAGFSGPSGVPSRKRAS